MCAANVCKIALLVSRSMFLFRLCEFLRVQSWIDRSFTQLACQQARRNARNECNGAPAMYEGLRAMSDCLLVEPFALTHGLVFTLAPGIPPALWAVVVCWGDGTF